MTSFKSLTVCLDMCGCPNRCAHCWLGAVPNGSLTTDDLRFVAEQFRPFTSSLEVADWYREPDFHDDYKERWELCAALSDRQTPHFELISYWRAVRDSTYLDWIKSQGVRTAQLTFFGGEALTDRCAGRKGAYQELVKTIGLLLDKEIVPRIQVFANKETLPEMPLVERMIEELRLPERCAAFGGAFSAFVHAGSCDGENEKHYGIWVTPEDLEKIPPLLAQSTLRHFGEKTLPDVFGETESALCARLSEDGSTQNYVEDAPVFYVDRNFDVYPNITAPAPFWRLGTLRTDGAEAVLQTYLDSASPAQHAALTVPVREFVRAYGNPDSERLFGQSDYLEFLLNRWCRERS